MKFFISNLEKSLESNIPLLSLAGIFILIDAISAVNSANGIATSKKFKAWMKKFLPEYVKQVSPDDFYRFRCSILHQMYGGHHKSSYKTLLFLPASSKLKGHRNIIKSNEKKALQMGITLFAKDVILANKDVQVVQVSK